MKGFWQNMLLYQEFAMDVDIAILRHSIAFMKSYTSGCRATGLCKKLANIVNGVNRNADVF